MIREDWSRIPNRTDDILPIRSAMREIGTATSVDQITVPSGFTASVEKRAFFLADHIEFISFSVVTLSNVLAL
jgi:hypothetical protein